MRHELSWRSLQAWRREGESSADALVRYGRATGWRVVAQTDRAAFVCVRWWLWPLAYAWYRRPRVLIADRTVYVTWPPLGLRVWPPSLFRWE